MKNGSPYFRPDNRGDRFPVVNTGKHHCLTVRCRGVVNKKKEKTPYCHRCKWMAFKNNNPLKYSFGNLRRRARQRGHEFNLTFEEYKSFAEKTNYAAMKGKTSLSLSVDRRDGSKGYEFSNIRAITLQQNSRREHVPYFQRQMHGSEFLPDQEDIRLAEESNRQSLME